MKTICKLDRNKLKGSEKFVLDLVQSQRLDIYDYDVLAERVCKIAYDSKEEMMEDTVAGIITKFKRSVNGTKVWIKNEEDQYIPVTFDSRSNYHLYRQLGLYSLIGLTYLSTSQYRYIVNGKKKRVNVPRLQFHWKL